MTVAEANTTAVVAVVVSVFALLVAVAALSLQAWEKFVSKPDIWPATTWFEHADGWVLQINVINTGFRQGVVARVTLQSGLPPQDQTEWVPREFLDVLPLVLPPDGASRTLRADMSRAPTVVRDALARRNDPQIKLLVTIVKRVPSELAATRLNPAEQTVPFPVLHPYEAPGFGHGAGADVS